jgi:hypothetical protein
LSPSQIAFSLSPSPPSVGDILVEAMMMHDIIRCYADVLCFKTTLRLPPQPVADDPQSASDDPAPAEPFRFHRLLRLAKRIAGTLAQHLEGTGTASALAGKRSFRRIGG